MRYTNTLTYLQITVGQIKGVASVLRLVNKKLNGRLQRGGQDSIDGIAVSVGDGVI